MYSQLYVSISKVACPVLAISSTLSDLLLNHNNIKHTTCKTIEIHFELPKTHPFPPTILFGVLSTSMVFLVQKKTTPKQKTSTNNESSIFRTPSSIFVVSRVNSKGPLGYLDVGHHLLARSCDPFLALTSQAPCR